MTMSSVVRRAETAPEGVAEVATSITERRSDRKADSGTKSIGKRYGRPPGRTSDGLTPYLVRDARRLPAARVGDHLAARDRGRDDHLRHDGLHHRRQSQDPGGGGDPVRPLDGRDDPERGVRYAADGPVGEPPVRGRALHGPERV